MTDSRRTAPDMTPAEALADKVSATRRVILWERVWPALVAPAAVIALFLAFSWFGLWLEAPRWLRVLGVAVFLGGFLYSLKGFFEVRAAQDADARAKLDRDSGVPHRPVEAMSDTLSLGSDDQSKALWALHQKRAQQAVERLKVAAPDPGLRRRDPLALRFAPFALAIAALFAAGPDLTNRVTAAFQWTDPPVPPAPPRLDVWLDPPAYTGRPPQFLVRSQSPEQQAAGPSQAPVNSVLVLRASPPEGVSIDASGALEPAEGPAVAQGAIEKRFTLSGTGEAIVRRGSTVLGRFNLTAIPDMAPTITLKELMQTETRDGLKITYSVKDDYGVKEGEAKFSAIRKDGEAPRRTLVEPPTAPLALPYGNQQEADGETTVTLTDHAWAGARVRLQLFVKDDAGNTGQSEIREVTLPQRIFTNPLAKALVEQRRNLVLDPERKSRVQIALDALLIDPDRYYAKQHGTYMGLRIASQRLRAARTDDKLLEVAEWLWSMALELDGNGLSEAEKALREAQERLKEALDRNADAAEIKRLTDELRRAMERYMREFAERAQREGRTAEQQQNDPNMRMLNRNDMQKMLEEIERLSREGRHAEAQELLRQLNEAMQNLQAQRGQPGQQGQREQGMNESLNELDQMTRDQQQLRDRTYRDGQQRRRQAQQGQRGQQGQQGQRQQGQRGQQSQQGEGGEQDMAEGGEGAREGEGQGLQQRQQRLRERLEQLQRRMRELGMNGERGLSEAEQAMRDAEGQLGQGQEGRAVDSQGRALEGLRRGMQGMAQQMQQGEGQGEGEGQAEGPGGQDDPNRTGQPRAGSNGRDRDDPLGRDRLSRGHGDNTRFRMQDGDLGSVGERARRVLDELRRRLGESERPKIELDYFERLLPKN